MAESIKFQGEMKKAYDDQTTDYKLVQNEKKEAIAKCRLLNAQLQQLTRTVEEQDRIIQH